MTFDDLLKKITTEPDKIEQREVYVPSAELLDRLKSQRGMPLTEFLSDPRRRKVSRTYRTGHVLGPPASPEAIAEWEQRWPGHAPPADLQKLLGRANGIHLWASLDTGRAYQGLAPIEEWELARTKMWGPQASPDTLPDKYVAISYHTDDADFIVLDVEQGRYYWMDACGADQSCPIGGSVNELLDWLWEHRIP